MIKSTWLGSKHKMEKKKAMDFMKLYCNFVAAILNQLTDSCKVWGSMCTIVCCTKGSYAATSLII